MRQAGAMRAGSLAGVAVSAGGLLWAFGPGLSDLPAGPGLTLQWMRADPERALLTATALAAWVLLAWLALGLLVCTLTAVPGTAGSVAERLSRHVVPATLRRAAGLAVGASLATAPVLSAGTAFAAPAVPDWRSAAPVVPPPVLATPQRADPAGQAQGPEGGWPDLGRHPSAAPPGDSTGTTPPPPPTPSDTPAPAQPRPYASATTAPPTTAARAPAAADAAPASPSAPDQTTSPGPNLADPASPAEPSPTESGTYRVRRGDCLWSIAARSLGPGAGPAAIEAAWHGWYRANRDVIGADPNLLLPGQRLTPPSG